MIEHSIRRNKHGEAVWTIRITGANEIFRFAFHQARGQIEFLQMGTRAFRYLRRQWGVRRFTEHDQVMTGGAIVKHGYHLDREEGV